MSGESTRCRFTSRGWKGRQAASVRRNKEEKGWKAVATGASGPPARCMLIGEQVLGLGAGG